MAQPLLWKLDEGYDIHVLRGGPSSKALDSALVLDTSTNALPPKFIPHFKGAPGNLGVTVDPKTGEVTAQAQSPSPPTFPNFNFIMTAQQIVGGVGTSETKIRVHIHESIQQIWLTPPTLSAHLGSDECRFTVLALFGDGTIGDITDWPQLALTSSDPNIVAVLPDGRLQAKKTDKDVRITAELKLSSPAIDKTGVATAFAQPGWDDIGKAAEVQWVAGPIRPNESDLANANPDGVDAVVDGNANVLFIAEGFRKDQETIFRRKIVNIAVKRQLLTEENLQPFKLLDKSINYWAVFVESRQEGVTVLGDAQTNGLTSVVTPVPLPIQPAPSATNWTTENMLHEAGLRLPSEPRVANVQAWVTDRSTIYDLPAGLPNSPGIQQPEFEGWNAIGSRLQLNEVNSAFGLVHYDRPRVSGQDYSLDMLRVDRRRMSDASLQTFVQNLRFGEDPTTGVRYALGGSWLENSFQGTRGRDRGRVCFVCWSGTRGGMFASPGSVPGTVMSYFTASVGRGDRVLATPVANGRDILPPKLKEFSPPIFSSLFAYGCGRALGLGDELGDGVGKAPGPTTSVPGDNLESGILVNVSGGVRTIDATKIRWLWPRVTNVALIDLQVDINGVVTSPQKCDQNGNPNPKGAFLLVKLLKPPLTPFAKSDPVRIRASFTKFGSDVSWQHPSNDEIVAFPLEVEQPGTTSLVLAQKTPTLPQLGYFGPASGTKLDPSMFSKVEVCFVMSARIEAGQEVKLISDPIRQQIDTSDSPLNAPAGTQGQACTPAPHGRADVPATNLPANLKLPPGLATKADIIGIYDGGGGFDCEVFRPGGRCRMRQGLDATTPFCAVCRYVIVDRVDPMVHKALDDVYELQFPR
jgi:hypothetical protein